MLTVAVVTFGNAALDRHARVLEALEILLGRGGPGLLHVGALGLVAEEVADVVLAAELALQVHERERAGHILLLRLVSAWHLINLHGGHSRRQ